MKKLYLIILALFPMGYIASQDTTTDIAWQMGYYEFMIDLRNEARDYLESIERQMKSIVQQLHYYGKYRIANERKFQFQQAYDRLSLAFDKAFEAVDRMFVMQGSRLTDTYAPRAQKEFLVSTAMKDAQAAVEHLTRRAEIHRLNLIRRAIGANQGVLARSGRLPTQVYGRSVTARRY